MRLLWVWFALLLGSCAQEPARIEFGRDWNPQRKVVADTTGVFHVNDPILIQLYNEKPFAFPSVLLRIYQSDSSGSSRLIHSREIDVKPSEASLVIRGGRGPSALTARSFLHSSQAGIYIVEFSQQGITLASRTIELFRAQEK